MITIITAIIIAIIYTPRLHSKIFSVFRVADENFRPTTGVGGSREAKGAEGGLAEGGSIFIIHVRSEYTHRVIPSRRRRGLDDE